MGEILTTAASLAANWWDVILAAVGLFALIATKTPNQSDDAIANGIWKAVNFLGANLGKAKNSDDA